MTRTALPLALCAAMLACLGPALAAPPTRVFVAAQGSDSNPCTFAQPCRSFQHAHDTVAAGGEIGQRRFGVTPPSVQEMILALERAGLIRRLVAPTIVCPLSFS